MTAVSSSEVACDFDIVTLDDVSRYYGRRRALSKVSLTCRGSSIVGLFGPNGAGKSTVLGLLSTIVATDERGPSVTAHRRRRMGRPLAVENRCSRP
jgi:ABC-type multidrug transport system ATPase subunit